MLNWKLHIETNPEILFGKPVIKGTRIPVDLILEKLASGNDINELIQAYPNITKEGIVACLLFASDTIKHEIAVA